MSSREVVLQRIRTALGEGVPVPTVQRAYRGAGGSGTYHEDAVVRLFANRVAEYRAAVHEASANEMADLLRRLVAGDSVLAVPHLAARLGPQAQLDDPPLGSAELERYDTVVTGCRCAIAETGTIVLDGGPECGRRAISLIPDRHICVVRADQILTSVPDAIAALATAAQSGLPLTFVSGPSATSDIELERVEGVHGPRRLEVVVVGQRGASTVPTT